MRECLIILSILVSSSVAIAKDHSNKTHHCCKAVQNDKGSGNVTKIGHFAPKGMPERARRSVSGDRDPRANLAKALLDTSSKEFLPARGRRANFGELRGLNSAENPFWAARGRRDFESSKEDPFWAARGKKLLENSIEKDDPFWAARGKKLLENSIEKDDPFWAARGKKLLEASAEDPFWAARGKKLLKSSSAEDPFWAARGKKLLLEASAENPFWAARGKKLLLDSSAEDPFWAARGKKLIESAEDPFYAARGRRMEKSKEASGSKENPFWAARGKREDPKVMDGSREVGVLKPRANRQPGEEFWPARGKRPTLPSNVNSFQHVWTYPGRLEEAVSDDDVGFWTRFFGLDDEDSNASDVVAQILGIRTNTQKIKKQMGRNAPAVNPWYSTDFWATRG
ncbi:uncharacterized protein LOC132195309 [Neocloeon triangulifer]|uniref:uncharacterized protein LOC132195309 n=1 Tax=Neocloeon triangulifer TaxID=2078957 RepID=UPI00286EE630|nr:uncharacterized protein LOC132195309 [Neocloeon triangulifer]